MTEPAVSLDLPSAVLGSLVLQVESDREVTELFRPRTDIVVMRILGHLSTRAAMAATNALQKEVGDAPFHMFSEWTAITGYDAAARKHITDWVVHRREQVQKSWFCAGNRMVEMGISVGAMAVALFGVEAVIVSYDEWLAALEGEMTSR